MKQKLDHIGVAVRNIERTIPFYTEMLGGVVLDRYTSDVPGVETHVAVIDVHGDIFELLEPTSPTSPIAAFLKQKGKGVHHLAYLVQDLDAHIAQLRSKGIRFLEDTYRMNSRGRRLIYLNPADTEGTIIELCDYPKQTQEN